ncbi:hypothetical protein F4860DRAFT_525589 [Xylaria cubensis]|nr:hypothetical protein F4860DRAFT_525589 [Xylaria cubensis]
MDGLYIDTFGMLPSDDLPNNSALSQSAPDSSCTYPNKPTPCSTHGSLDDRQENDVESSEINRSALELAVHRARATRLSPLSSEKEDDFRRIALMQNSENEGEKLIEEPPVVDEVQSCCCTRGCSCIYNRGDDSTHRSKYDAGFDPNSHCCCCCCEGNYGLRPLQDNYGDDDVIEIEFGHILALVKFCLASATYWAKQAYIRTKMAVGLGQHRDDEVDWNSLLERLNIPRN